MTAALVYRDYVIDAIPASGAHHPVKSEIRALLAPIDNLAIVPAAAGSSLIINGPGGTPGNSNSLWTSDGAKVVKLLDRVMVGAEACKSIGDAPQSVPDWLNTLIPAITQNAQLTVISTRGLGAIAAGTRTSEFPFLSGGCIALVGVGQNDNTSVASGAWGAYLETHRSPGVTGTAIGCEIDPANHGSVVALTPFNFFPPGLTAGLWVASGADGHGGAPTNATVAIGILNNGAAFETGIAFKNEALAAHGTGGNGIAVAMAGGQELAWYSSAASGTVVCELWGDSSGSLHFAGASTSIFASSLALPSPATKTGNHSLVAGDSSLTFNGSGSITLTLQSAATFPGRLLFVRTIAAQPVVSAASDVVPLAGGAAGTAILAATAGKWATLQSNGTNWEIIASN